VQRQRAPGRVGMQRLIAQRCCEKTPRRVTADAGSELPLISETTCRTTGSCWAAGRGPLDAQHMQTVR